MSTGALGMPTRGRVRIIYQDDSGEQTTRVIEPQEQYRGRNGYTYIRAYCHKRNDTRTFRADRVVAWSAIEAETLVRAPTRDSPRPAYSPSAVPAVWVPRPTSVSPARPTPVVFAPSPIALSATAAPAPPPPRSGWGAGRGVAKFLWKAVAVGVVCLVFYSRWNVEQERKSAAIRASLSRMIAATVQPRAVTPVPLPAPRPRPLPAPARRVVVPERTVPSPPPHPATEPAPESTISYRGIEIRVALTDTRKRYVAAALGLASSDLQLLRMEINGRAFREATGVESAEVVNVYAAADTDQNGELSWSEIGAFQDALTARYRYQANEIALRPDEFMAQGGGDCDDWALMTAGLMRFWGLTNYVGIFSASGDTRAHAVCLVRTDKVPSHFGWYDVSAARTWDGEPVEPGRYIVVDYDSVGRTSNAVGAGWALTQFYDPERMYGRPL